MSGYQNVPSGLNAVPVALGMSPREKPRIVPLLFPSPTSGQVLIYDLKELYESERFTTFQSLFIYAASGVAATLSLDQVGWLYAVTAPYQGAITVPAAMPAVLTVTVTASGGPLWLGLCNMSLGLL
jgi:hypothetical protein